MSFLIVSSLLFPSEIDEQIIKELDFFMNMEYVEDDFIETAEDLEVEEFDEVVAEKGEEK